MHKRAIALVVALVSLCTACGDAPETEGSGETETEAAEVETASTQASLQTLATLKECIAAGKGGTSAREQFCRSVPSDKARACWSRIYVSVVEWIGWCSWNFS
jgi:hypothetical protein